MKTNAGSIVQKLIFLLSAFCAMTIILLYIINGNIGGLLLYQVIATGVLCVYLIYTIYTNSRIMQYQPLGILLIAGFYLIFCLLQCFPNQIPERFAWIYLLAIPVAYFFGFRDAFVVILFTAFINCGYEITRADVQHIGYIVITAMLASGKQRKGLDVFSGITAFLLQGILLVISKGVVATDLHSFLTELCIITVNSVVIPVVYRLSQIKTSVQSAEERTVEAFVTEPDVAEWAVTDNQAVLNDEGLSYPLELSYLVSDDCVILKSMYEYAPRAVERAKEVASFARRIAYKSGANSDLVYAAAIYHDIERIYKGAQDAAVVLPEYLYTIVKRQNEKQAPVSLEELIVLLSNNVLSIYHYMVKKHPQISISKVIDNLFALQLKNGNIMSAGISMSVYHKMRQEFTNEFLIYLENKK